MVSISIFMLLSAVIANAFFSNDLLSYMKTKEGKRRPNESWTLFHELLLSKHLLPRGSLTQRLIIAACTKLIGNRILLPIYIFTRFHLPYSCDAQGNSTFPHESINALSTQSGESFECFRQRSLRSSTSFFRKSRALNTLALLLGMKRI
jgi:hypothetical protein